MQKILLTTLMLSSAFSSESSHQKSKFGAGHNQPKEERLMEILKRYSEKFEALEKKDLETMNPNDKRYTKTLQDIISGYTQDLKR